MNDLPATRKNNPLLPDESRLLSTFDSQQIFICHLVECRGNVTLAAAKFGCSTRVIYYRKQEFPDFAEAVEGVKEGRRQEKLDTLEDLSYAQALEPANFKERKLNLQALAPERYRERHQGGPS